MNYATFQNMTSSEKLTLATLEASKRLMGWTLDSGSVYSIPFTQAVIAGIEDSGTSYTEAGSVGAVTAGKYYLDRSAGTLYLRTTGSDNPNGRFIVVTVKFFFANAPIALPHDLASGFEVAWEQLLQSTSQFGVEIDTVNQTSEAIEGSGSLSLINDYDFWPANFDKWFFENQRVRIYSFHRDMDPEDARLLFKGRVERKTYSDASIKFQLKDQFAELRAPISLGLIEDLSLRTGADLAKAQQRTVLGRVFGHVPVNVDQELDGYPLTGTVSVSFGGTTVTGSGTAFLTQLSPDDDLVLDGETYTVASVASNTSLELTESFGVSGGLSSVTAYVLAESPKRYMNRIWKLAGHALREPVTTVTAGSSVTQIYVADNSDLYAGDWVYIGTLGSGELAQIDEVLGDTVVKLSTSLSVIPGIGTALRRPAVQNVRINDTLLVYYTDYTLDASTATLTLRTTAESNSGPVRQMATSLSFTNTSRTVTGTGIKGVIEPGYMVGVVGNATFFEVLSVDSDTQLTLRSAASFTANTTGRYKPLIFDPSVHTLSLDLLGKTEDGTTTGALLKTAPAIVKSLLTDAGLEDEIDEGAFDSAEGFAPQHIGLVTPDTFNSTQAATYRDVINSVNRSVFGSLVQNSDFQFAYEILKPSKPASTTRFSESDILSFTADVTSENVVKTAIISYLPNEYDYLTGNPSVATSQKSSDTATHILKTAREKTFKTYLVDSNDARIHAARWAFLLERGTARITFTTKLQGASIEIGDIVDIEHRKLFERMGGGDSRRIMLVESVKKSGELVSIEATDLSNSFNRVACITSATGDFSSATDEEKLYGGYITDAYGLIDNDPETESTNLIW